MTDERGSVPDPDNEVFRALADPSRRLLLDRLNAHNGQTLRELCEGLGMARQSVSKHLAVLEAANLLTTVRRGREKLHYLNPVPINALADRWLTRYDRRRTRALADLKSALEQGASAMSKPAFVYTTYIATTPDRLWEALTTPSFTSQYWGVTLDSDWQVGSTVTWQFQDATMADPEQVVLAAEPGRLLSYTWHSITPEFARAAGIDEELRAALAAEPRSQVTFAIDPAGEKLVRLTVTHEGFAPDSPLLDGISQGWPAILASLKTLLETGSPLPDPAPAS
ncbi:metalloregulator ArsR/SmtB family transcription factor [Streptomyces sp. DSM 44917]|uniref:Metalloregulator ArsR/SmtB family transcription factor n=1 Tax=Streptomyces boetiae TaxID=3075541 RepID=A0ABU2LEL5_9ACTN|nr:metalloregulator ArsR/SmtB family transcription factor [Streptomyces sp. DSM 44917]MDT0309712.1 metalloregulator ArsR/SmtB family transcription factor [Streptomyces sp. DSM 44917]